jgi:Cu(I)/Ag(I) efflux system protein CusF
MMKGLIAAFAIGFLTTAAFAETVPVTGLVTKINEAQGKLTLRHEPIPNLDMDSMTMVFTLADSKMLENLEVGDKVVFEADRVDGRITIISITEID